MPGLDFIVQKILDDAQKHASSILEEGQSQAAQIEEAARKEAEQQSIAIVEQANANAERVMGKARSSSEMEVRKRKLGKKNTLIEEILQMAQTQILELQTVEYFEVVTTLVQKFALPKPGVIRFSEMDLARLPQGYADTLCRLLPPPAALTIGAEAVPIQGGFVLQYGEIEVNCNFAALFEAEKEQLRDRVNAVLWQT